MSADCCGPDHHHIDPDRGRRGLSPRAVGRARHQRRHVPGRDRRGRRGRLGLAAGRRARLLRRCRQLRHQPVRHRHGAALSRLRGAGQGHQHGPVRPLGDRHRDLARGARHVAQRLHDGRDRLRRVRRQRRVVRAAVGLSRTATPTCARPGSARATMPLGNLAVLLAAARRVRHRHRMARSLVAAIMAGLALQGSWLVLRQSLGELRQPVPLAAHR